MSISIDIALHVMGVHGIGTHADAVINILLLLAVVLRHHEIANKASCFAHIELLLPAVSRDVFVLTHAPFRDLSADILGHPRVIG